MSHPISQPSRSEDSLVLNRADSNTTKTHDAPVPSLRFVFKTTAAANRLPVELLIMILTSGAWTTWRELLVLTHICQYWRNVARGTPRLWADAVASVVKCGIGREHPCLPVFLELSVPFSLRLEARGLRPVLDLSQHTQLKPHFSRISQLSVNLWGATQCIRVLEIVRSLRGLQILRISGFCNDRFWVEQLPVWNDADLPLLHTLRIPGRLFAKPIAVKSLKTVILHDGPYSYDVFFDALERCAAGLESLTLFSWGFYWRLQQYDPPTPSPRATAIHLLALRHFNIGLETTHSPALLFSALSLPPDITIELSSSKGSFRAPARQLLPQNLVGLHAPPFFDSRCLVLEGSGGVELHCYACGVERLCLGDHPRGGPELAEFLGEHQSANITELTIDLREDEQARIANGDVLRQFVKGFWNLRRLELLGSTAGDVKLQMVEGFLELSRNRTSPSAQERCLAYVCGVPSWEASGDEEITVGLRTQLDRLEALLDAHLAAGGHRLGRLELGFAYLPSGEPLATPPPKPPNAIFPPLPYRHIGDVRAGMLRETVLPLPALYLPRFQPLVDEIVFVGND